MPWVRTGAGSLVRAMWWVLSLACFAARHVPLLSLCSRWRTVVGGLALHGVAELFW